MNKLKSFAIPLLLIANVASAEVFVAIPDTAVVAVYVDKDGEHVASESLIGVTGRVVRGFVPSTPLPPTTNPVPAPQALPPLTIPEAVTAIYLDMDSRIVAIEFLSKVKGRIGMDLGLPQDAPPCTPKCTINGPNGTYCIC
jgi:hypothetical protein